MSEDTPGNPGVARRLDADSAARAVRRMQLKLHRWASEDSARRFDDLYNLVHDPAFLVTAWERVAGNSGAQTPGVDRATVALIESQGGVEVFLERIRAGLKSGTFQPRPVRRVEIPKASGKVRRLGIPTVADRVVQAALKLVLEPIYEADFLPCSYGFRPNRRAQDAIAEIHHMATNGYHWVLEADIRACFDTIDHTALMGRLRLRITDKRVLALIKAFLKAGVMTASGVPEDSLTGTPQGGILSPLLANIALSVLDEHFDQQWKQQMGTWQIRGRRRRQGLSTWRLIRYADDFVVVVNGHRHDAEALRDEVEQVIAPLGLRLAPDKTQVVGIDEGFDFLGFRIRRMRKRGTSKHYIYTVPSPKALKAIRVKVRARTSRSWLYLDLDQLLRSVNRSLQGWANYFRHGVSKATFAKVDDYAWHRIVSWLRRKHKGMPWKAVKRRFCDRGWRLAHNGIIFRGASSVSVSRYRYRGSKIPTPWTPKPAVANGG